MLISHRICQLFFFQESNQDRYFYRVYYHHKFWLRSGKFYTSDQELTHRAQLILTVGLKLNIIQESAKLV